MKKARKQIFVFLLLVCAILKGQEINQHLMPGHYYLNAVQQYNDEKYHLAQQQFKIITEQQSNFTKEEIEVAFYYQAMCAIELQNPDAGFLANRFLELYPSSGKVDQMRYELGKYFFKEKEFGEAAYWFNMVVPKNIQKNDKADYFFSSGYCLFSIDDIENARLKFYEIKDGDNLYSPSAKYYYAHINYSEGNYQTALEDFEKLKNDSTFAAIVPYYISQIYFLQEKYNDVVRYAADFLVKVTEKRKAEVARIVAESHFKLKQYKEAIPYYNLYTDMSEAFSEADYYQAGYSYYYVGEYEKAAGLLEKISNNDSPLGQNASYHLADCYIKLNDKKKAMIAFSNASKTEYDTRVKEDALFNKAVLNYELNASAFSESIRDFEEYIEMYPKSARVDEAYNYLVLAYLNTKNYSYALQSLARIKTQTDDVKKAYQHIAFYRGVELVSNYQYEEAIKNFDLSIKYYSYNKTLRALSYFWKGDCNYRLERYNEAVNAFKEFILLPGAFPLSEYKTAHYNLGYCYFKKAQYIESLSWFRKYIDMEANAKGDMLADAYNRAGDLFFLQNNYTKAIEYYTGSVQLNGLDADYALFQKSFAYGLMADYNNKIKFLEKLIVSYPSSAYLDDAHYEAALSYQLMGNLQQALKYFTVLVNNYHGSSFEKSALVQLGLIYYNTDKADQAIASYKKVVSLYPGSKEAGSALRGLKNIYLEQNSVESYLSYVNEQGGDIKISQTETDSLLFVNAENIYFEGNCDKSIVKLKEYLNQQQNSPFSVRAYIYLADCYNQQGRKQDALIAYNKVISFKGLEYKENALLEASRINFEMEDYQAALANYLQLEELAQTENNQMEARIGKMRCYYNLNDHQGAIDAAKVVLESKKLNPVFEKQAQYFIGKAYLALDNGTDALEYFIALAKNVKTQEGAEAKYRLAEIYKSQKKYEKAETEVYDFIKLNTPHQSWIAKSYILLADIFLIKEDYFQASHTVQSIIDYYEIKDDGILEEARSLNEEIAKREEKEKNKKKSDLELNIENN